MRADSAVYQQLQEVGAQHVPVVIVVLLTFVATHHKSANSPVRQQSFINSQIGQVGLDCDPLLLIQRLTWLDGVQRRRRVTGSSANGSGGKPGGRWSRTSLAYASGQR